MAEARSKLAEEGKARSTGFLTASDIDPLSAAFRKLVGLDEIQGKYKFMKSKKALLKSRVALLDLMKNQYALCGEHISLCGVRNITRVFLEHSSGSVRGCHMVQASVQMHSSSGI